MSDRSSKVPASRAGAKANPVRKPGKGSMSAREMALDVITRVEQDRSYSNLLLHRTLEKYKPERQEAALATELVYGTIQRMNTIDYFLGRFVAKGMGKLEPWVRNLLRLSFYQLYYLDRVPSHAAVNEAVNLAKKKGHAGISGMVNGVLRNVLRQKDTLRIPDNAGAVERISLAHSHPEWMVARWIRRFGEETAERICAANNEPPKTSARVNRLKMTREDMLRLLEQEGLAVEPSGLAPNGIVVEGGGNLAMSPHYAAGDWTIQDESSMLVAEIVDPKPGMAVLDCCAAPGGKTTHMAEKMGNEGRIVACDVHEHKEKLIREQAERLGLTCIDTVVTDAAELPARFPEAFFDRILLDAPCSGLGVIRRKPDLKWSKQESEIAEIQAIQYRLLDAVHPLLKPGGILVYSTCTLEDEENSQQVERFLSEHPEFERDSFPDAVLPEQLENASLPTGTMQILPHQYGSDGFFIARLRKKV